MHGEQDEEVGHVVEIADRPGVAVETASQTGVIEADQKYRSMWDHIENECAQHSDP